VNHGDVLAKTGEAAKAGPIGLAVILLLCIACYFLFKSMSKHMREVRENFPTDDAPRPAGTAGAPTDVPRAEVVRTERTEPQRPEQPDS
jgi:hypothetical protein